MTPPKNGELPAAVWAMELDRKIERPQEVLSFLIPVLVSAVFLLLLVARLGLIARVAQERALELARRSAALATAASEQEDLQRQLAHRAMHDPLTGLANRLVFLERMEWALNRRNSTGNGLSCFDAASTLAMICSAATSRQRVRTAAWNAPISLKCQ